jgi:acetoacetyl-CoA synthetase
MPRESSSQAVVEGTLLWEPSESIKQRSNVSRYMRWLASHKGLDLADYPELWQWSVSEIESFWVSIWEFYEVGALLPDQVALEDRSMPGARWFAGVELNYAERALARNDNHPAVVFKAEDKPLTTITYRQLRQRVASVAGGLRRLGVGKGDRVVAYMPNIPETVVAFLATASIGATWAVCSPEFGTKNVVDRFKQIAPKVLLAVDGYRYGGKAFQRLDAVAEIEAALPSLENTVVLPYLASSPALAGLKFAMPWEQLETAGGDTIEFERVPFDHPLWVLYSSGTTGLPKPIVHGHGGIVLEHLKVLSLHLDLMPEDRFFWFTTTGWMMWNLLVGGLLLGTTVVLYDGDPVYPDMSALWGLAEETSMTYFGASAPYIHACMKDGMSPGQKFELSRIRSVGSTGAPLSPEGFGWVYDSVGSDLLLASFSGGSDMCTGFVGSSPLLPVRAGEIQCLGLGAKVEAYDQDGKPLIDEVGELVITEPLPSMPVYFWNDPANTRYTESYFERFPGVWRHGDWIKISPKGSCMIYGRSDATLNRGGVRMGTSEFYRVVDVVDGVADSLVVDTGDGGETGKLLLFVVMVDGAELDDEFSGGLRAKIRSELSPRHVPDAIYAIDEVPKTLNGKKLEIPVKRVLAGVPLEQAVSEGAMANPGSVDFFVDMFLSQDS